MLEKDILFEVMVVEVKDLLARDAVLVSNAVAGCLVSEMTRAERRKEERCRRAACVVKR